MATIQQYNDDGYRSSEDEDFMPQEEDLKKLEKKKISSSSESRKDEGDNDNVIKQLKNLKKKTQIDNLWAELNESNEISKKASDKSKSYLDSLLGKSSMKAPRKKKKVHEFKIPSLGVDKKRKREEALQTDKQGISEVVKFAGKEYSVSRSVEKKSSLSGLDQMVAATQEVKKISTIEKTSLDWDKFKKTEGIEDELHQYTKDGYLEKQDFLQRVDERKFELEKAERAKHRKPPQM